MSLGQRAQNCALEFNWCYNLNCHNWLYHQPLSIVQCYTKNNAYIIRQFSWASGDLCYITTTTTILRPFFQDRQGEPVPQENFWTLWCKGRLTETETPTICHSSWTNQCPPPPFPIFLQVGCPYCRPTNSVKALKDLCYITWCQNKYPITHWSYSCNLCD